MRHALRSLVFFGLYDTPGVAERQSAYWVLNARTVQLLPMEYSVQPMHAANAKVEHTPGSRCWPCACNTDTALKGRMIRDGLLPTSTKFAPVYLFIESTNN